MKTLSFLQEILVSHVPLYVKLFTPACHGKSIYKLISRDFYADGENNDLSIASI